MSNSAKSLLSLIETKMSREEIMKAAQYVNKFYSMFMPDTQLWGELKGVFGQDYANIFFECSKEFIANKFINELLLNYYPCERTIKYLLAKAFINKDNTVVFEMQSINSRVDVCRVNGGSYAYEIKTEYDDLRRLKKQISDYLKLYEYVTVVISERYYEQALGLIEDDCGIMIFPDNTPIKLNTIRRPNKSKIIDAEQQLYSLSMKELKQLYKKHKIKTIPCSKAEMVHFIMTTYSKNTINQDYKKLLKEKYKTSWEFIKLNYSKILPIDIQSFFHNSISPELIYYYDAHK